MARTKASVGAKVAAGKSSKARCSAAPPPSYNSGSSERSSSRSTGSGGGNSVCPRDTPKWQRPITNFFMGKGPSHSSDEDEEKAASSSKPKRNIIHSDDEETEDPKTPTETVDKPNTQTSDPDPPTNKELDDTIELEPLTGDDSHKIEEYYPKNGVKGKGKGKKTNKENIDANVDRRKSVKRDLEDVEVSENVSKKVKVN